MRPYARVRKLTEKEYQELKRWERSRTIGVSKVRRARVVLLSHRGLLVQEIAEKLEGLYRHASTHAAGMVIGDRPL